MVYLDNFEEISHLGVKEFNGLVQVFINLKVMVLVALEN